MQLIETYTTHIHTPIWFQFNESACIHVNQKSLRLTDTSVKEMNRYITANLLKKITGKTWSELCN